MSKKARRNAELLQPCKCGCGVLINSVAPPSGGRVRLFYSKKCWTSWYNVVHRDFLRVQKHEYNIAQYAVRRAKLFALGAVELYLEEIAWKKADSNDPPSFAVNSYRSSSPYQCSSANRGEDNSTTGELREATPGV